MTAPNLLFSKFKGCLLGALLGDCLGEPFEFIAYPVERLNEFFQRLKKPDFKLPVKHHSGKLPYTDDTAQTKVLAKHLIQKGSIDINDFGQKLSKEFLADMRRGYGSVKILLVRFHDNPEADVLQMARAQFDGKGSFGNGAAMRIAPIALFYHRDTQQMIEAARYSAQVTHAHRNGYNGAILQCLAVQQALSQDPNAAVDPIDFVRELRSKMKEIEATEESHDFCDKLEEIEEILQQSTLLAPCHVADKLGTETLALKSVPAAIFSYLIIQKLTLEEEVHTMENVFERTVHYAISLRGDTDTIASMAGAICGAHVGFDGIPSHMIPLCEDSDTVAQLAERLYKKSATNDQGCSCFPLLK